MFPHHATQTADTVEITVNTVKHEIRNTTATIKPSYSRDKSTIIYPAPKIIKELVSDREIVDI